MEVSDLPGHPNVGITLSGGGARGAAHIGVLRALAEFDIQPARVMGVSAGAIAGVLYCSGMSADDMLAFSAEISMVKVIKFGIPRTGLTTMDYLRERLRLAVPVDDFAALEKPLIVGATNLNTGRFQTLESGSLYEAIAASCSIPFVFKPVEIDGQLFVDGGIMNNLAVAPLEETTDYVIGSNLIPDKEVTTDELSSVIGISWRCFDLSVKANAADCRRRCDLLFEPPAVADHNIFSFRKIRELHDIGYDYARRRMEQLLSKVY